MNQLPIDKQCLIFNCLAEGNSIRSTARLADVSINAVMRTFVKLGEACRDYQNDRLRNLTCQRLQIEEISAVARVINDGLGLIKSHAKESWVCPTPTSLHPVFNMAFASSILSVATIESALARYSRYFNGVVCTH